MQSDLIDRLAVVLTDSEVKRIAELREVKPPEPPPPDTPPPPVSTPGITKIATGRGHEYSTMYPGNADHRWLLLQHADGFLDLVQTDGSLVRTLPAQINTGSQPRWSRKNPTCFWFLYLNEFRQYDVVADKVSTVRKFEQMSTVNGMGESDISEDDDHVVLCDGGHVFVYEISSDKVVAEFQAPGAFDSLYLTPKNEPVIGVYETGTHVLENGRLKNLTPSIGHMDVSSTKDGRSVLVRTNAADKTGVPEGCGNGIELVDTATGVRTCLLSLDWKLAVHVSSPDRAEFALVSTYAPGDPNSPVKYANELLKVMLDGSGVTSLAKHGAGTVPFTYEGTCRAAISPDGTHYVYDSKGDVYLGVL